MPELEALKYLFTGSFFGLVAGISPGPLLALVISETLTHNRAAGLKIAVSPLITDLPIILLTYYLLSNLAQSENILGIISLAGGIFLIYLGYKTVSVKEFSPPENKQKTNSLIKGIVVNALSPHAYLFWITIGTPYVLRAREVNVYAVGFFIAGFYLFLVGSKMIIAILASHSKAFLRQKSLILLMKVLGIALFIFAFFLIRDGIKLFREPGIIINNHPPF